MATGRSNKLVGQTGEYLVAAELSRRGFIATTFTGNVPHYDIIASDETGRDRFYICTWRRLRDLVVKGHRAFLERNNGVRPQRWDSLRGAISEKTLAPYLDRWDIIEDNLL